MAAFFGSVSSFFSSILNAISNLLLAPIYIIDMVVTGSAVIQQAISYIPGELFAFAASGVAICILYLILGR